MTHRSLSLAASALLALCALSAPRVEAQMQGSIPALIATGDIEAVVVVHGAAGETPGLVVDKAYLGDFKAGDTVPVTEAVYQRDFDFDIDGASLGAAQSFVLFLTKDAIGEFPSSVLGNGWSFNPMASKRLVGNAAYLWVITRVDAVAPKDALIAAELDTKALEAQIAEGLKLRERWQQMRAKQNPVEKLEMLRPFFTPADEHLETLRQTHQMIAEALPEIEKTGKPGVSFLQETLRLRYYQEAYDANNQWLSFGRQHRQMLQDSIKRMQANPVSSQ